MFFEKYNPFEIKFSSLKLYLLMIAVYSYVLYGAISTLNPVLIIFSCTFSVIFLAFILNDKLDFGYNSINWIHPILKLSSSLAKIDGKINDTENKKIKSFLEHEFTTRKASKVYKSFEEYLTKEFDVDKICRKIYQVNESKEKVQIIHFLVRIAISDRLLTKKEEDFLRNVVKKIGLPSSVLKTILELHNFTSEYEQQRTTNKTISISLSLAKSYTILGVNSTATMQEVKNAYRKLAKLYHPDKLIKTKRNKERAKQQFQLISDAYELIKNRM